MQSAQSLTPKRQHYNRFAYLLQPSKEKQKRKIQQQFNFISLSTCAHNLCKAQQTESQIKETKNLPSQKEKNIRKPLKYDLQSPKYQLFKRQMNQKPSVSSFIAYTPQKIETKDQFSIYNDISTIEYTKSNQMHTHRNLFESILEQQTQKIPLFQCQHQHLNRLGKTSLRVQTQNYPDLDNTIKIRYQESDPIKLELSQSDESPQELDVKLNKKHLRTLTEGNQHQNNIENNHNRSTMTQKRARIMQFIHKPQLQSIEVSEPSRHDSIQYSSVQQVLNYKDKKITGVTMTTLKTKKMSQKLQESSQLDYENSISVILNNSQSSSILGFHKNKSIKLGRRTIKNS